MYSQALLINQFFENNLSFSSEMNHYYDAFKQCIPMLLSLGVNSESDFNTDWDVSARKIINQ